MRREVENLVGFLQDNEIVALGDHANWPRRSNAKALVPNSLSVEEAKSVVTAALTSSRLRLAMLRGTMLKPSATPAEQTEVLSLIATLLPGCSLVCLNLGEWSQASYEAYEMILKNLSETGIGHLYWNSPETVQGTDALKPYAIEILRENRKKHFYLMQAADGEVWEFLKGGCQAWWNPQKDRYIGETFVRGVHSVAQEYKRKYQEMYDDGAIDYSDNRHYKSLRDVDKARKEHIRDVAKGNFLPAFSSAPNSTLDRNSHPISIQEIESADRLGWVVDSTELKLSQDALVMFNEDEQEMLRKQRFNYKGPIRNRFGPTSEVVVELQHEHIIDTLMDPVMKLLGFDENPERIMSATQLESAQPAQLPTARRVGQTTVGTQTNPLYGHRSRSVQTVEAGSSEEHAIQLL